MTPAKLVADYLNHKRGLGRKFTAEGFILRAFCKHLGECPTHRVSVDQMEVFVYSGKVSQDTVARKHQVLNGFCRYALARHDVQLPVLPTLPNCTPSSFVPYIYTQEELERLIQSTQATCRFRRALIEEQTMRTIVLLLYGAGLRLGEALKLNKDDVDISEAILTIRQTKFHKSRLVPLGKDLNHALTQYQLRDARPQFDRSDEPFLRMRNGKRVSQSVVERTWRRLRKQAGIERDGGPRNQPRLHDLRHTAAVHRLIAWYRSDADLDRLLPVLATYMGHGSLAGTQRYLTLTPELLREASRRFEHYALGGCDD